MIEFVETPIGWVQLTHSQGCLQRLEFIEFIPERVDLSDFASFCKSELDAYFSNPTHHFLIPLQLPLEHSFQYKVLTRVMNIPSGGVLTYHTIAKALSQPGASQAVGNANAQNPILIVIPCHRVIGSKHELKGYAGGLVRKQWLLEHEGYLTRQLDLF